MTRHPGDETVISRAIAYQEVTLLDGCIRSDCPLCNPVLWQRFAAARKNRKKS